MFRLIRVPLGVGHTELDLPRRFRMKRVPIRRGRRMLVTGALRWPPRHIEFLEPPTTAPVPAKNNQA